MLKAALVANKTDSAILECLQRKMPLHWGGMSDPFQPCERKYRISLKMLHTMNEYNYPLIISTKSNLLTSKPYLSILKNYSSLIVQISLCTSNDMLRQEIEPNAPSVGQRIKTISELSENGVEVCCRLQPFIPGVNSDDKRLVQLLKQAGCKKVIIEHYKHPIDSKGFREKKLNSIIGFNLKKEYKRQGAKRVGREYLLPAEIKLKNLSGIVEYIHDQGMKYCAADNDLQHLGDMDCCCGVDDVKGFENWFRHNIAFAIRKGMGKNEICYSLIEKEWVPRRSIRMYLNSQCRNDIQKSIKLSSMKDFIFHKWNQLYTTNSPTEFYGVNVIEKQKYNSKRYCIVSKGVSNESCKQSRNK